MVFGPSGRAMNNQRCRHYWGGFDSRLGHATLATYVRESGLGRLVIFLPGAGPRAPGMALGS